MSDENKKFVPEGVYLVCDKGKIVTQLLGSPDRNVYFYGVKACTDADNKFGINILSFGTCKTCGACKFEEIQWTKVKEKGSINNSKALLEHSEGLCKEGQGIIKIYFSKYEAGLANENQNESAFVKESLSSQILGTALTTPFGQVIDLFCKDDDKFTEGVGRGFKKGMESTWNFLSSDMWKKETWVGMGKLAVIGAAYSSPVTGTLMGDTTLRMLDNLYGTDFKQTKDNLVEGIKDTVGNAWEDVKRGNMGEVGETYGQLQYAIAEALMGTKGAGVAVKGATTGAKALIGAERLAQLSANFTKVLERIRMGSVIKVGEKIEKIADDLDPPGTKRNSIGQLYDEKTGRYVDVPKVKGNSKNTVKSDKSNLLKKNIQNGLKRENEVKNELIKEGHNVKGSQVSVKTKHTRRIVDHLIEEKDTKKIKAIEVKSGNAKRTPSQVLKDESMVKDGGKIIGKNAPKDLKNKTIKIETEIRK